jgi:hypothetical protein
MQSSRKSAGSLVSLLAFGALATVAVGCASSTPVGITKSDAMVAGCAKLGEVSIDKKTPDADVADALAKEARKQNGNYVVVAQDGAREGVAYRCTSPAIAASR